MPDYLPMLHANNVFRRPTLGMPTFDNSDPLAEAASVADEMKNRDMARAREMMEFQNRMQIQAEQRARMNAELERNKIDITGRKANKNYVTEYAPPTMMQQQFRQDKLLADQRAHAQELARTQGDTRLQQALLTGKLRNEGLASTAEAAGARAAEDRRSREQIAKDRIASTEKIAETGRTNPFNAIDPDTGQPISTIVNSRTGEAKPLNFGGRQLGPITRPGSGTGKIQGMTPEQLADLRKGTQETLELLTQIYDPKTGKLTDKGAYASGFSNLWRLPEYFPTPQQEGGSMFDSFKSKLVLDLVQRMKAASKTGATGFGALNLRELETFENAATRAAAGKGDAANEKALGEIYEKLVRMLDESEEEKTFKARQSRFQPAGGGPEIDAGSKLQNYSYAATPEETAAAYQPTRPALPITSQPQAPGTLTPRAQESLKILQQGRR